MPTKAKYPDNWKEISYRIRYERAKSQCECEGECGLHRTNPGPRRCVERDREDAIWADGKVILTVAHLDAEGDVCRCEEETGALCGNPEHLKAMCNRCHLRYDHPKHMKNAAKTRRAKKNNLELFTEAFV
jgi:hypothetical protein